MQHYRLSIACAKLRTMIGLNRRGDSTIVVDLAELALFDRELLALLQKWPDNQLKIFEAAASDALQRELLPAPEAAASCCQIVACASIKMF